MPVHPQARAFLDQAAGAPPMHQMPLHSGRAAFDAMAALGGPPEPIAGVLDRAIPGPSGPLPIRVYRPDARAGLPVALWFHAGGFSVGSLESHDPLCRAIANRSGCALVAVDYRLAPEHPFPAALDDAWAALQWVAAHGMELGLDPARIGDGDAAADRDACRVESQFHAVGSDPLQRGPGVVERGPGTRYSGARR